MKVNRNDLSSIIGKDARTIDKWVEDGMPYVKRPGDPAGEKSWLYDTVEVIDWMHHGREEQRDEAKEAKTKDLVASAGLKWLEYGKELGLTMPIEEFMPFIAEAGAIIKSRMNAMPGRLAQTLAIESDPATVQRLLREEVNQALSGMEADFAKMEQAGADKRASAREAGIIE